MRVTGLTIPLLVVTAYYLVTGGLLWLGVDLFPQAAPLLPLGGIDLSFSANSSFQEIVSEPLVNVAAANMVTLAMAIFASVLLMIPVTWVYILTHGRQNIQASMVQTIIALPIVVAGIAMVVQNSVALAFSLAGIVAAVRFRFALRRPSHGLFIFLAIGVGLAAGVSALEVGIVVSIGFVYAMMILWKLDYGDHLNGPLMSLFVGQERE